MSAALAAALEYAGCGFPVLPLHGVRDGRCTCGGAGCPHPGKHPRTANGLRDASLLPERIREWWIGWPDASVGIAVPEGFLVLDVDGPEGEEALRRAGVEFNGVPTVKTPRGTHYWFRTAGTVRPKVSILPRVDIRGPGSYVVAPPSVGVGGVPYTWLQPLTEEVPPAPAALLALLDPPRATSLPATGDLIPQGRRNSTLASLAGTMRRRGMGAAEIEAALRVTNQTRCVPPLSGAEVARIAGSVAQYPAEAGDENREPRLLSAAEVLAAADSSEPDWLVEGLLPSGGLSIWAGRPKAGKSTLARALAVAVVQGRDFLGSKARQGAVLLVSLEDRQRDVGRHLRRLGLRASDPLLVAPVADELEVGAWVRARRPLLVVVDTIGRLLKIREISEYGHVLAALDSSLRLARDSGAHLALLHHAGKGTDSRDPIDAPLGSTAFAGAADSLLHLKRGHDGIRTLAAVQRVGEDLPESVLVLGEDDWPSLAGTKADHQLAQVAEEILDFLRTRENTTRDEVLGEVEGKASIKVRALDFLHRQGRILRAGSGRRGDPFRFSVLPFPDISGNGGTEIEKRLETAPGLAESRSRDSGPDAGTGTESGTETALRQGGEGAADGEFVTPEDLARGQGQGQFAFRVGEATGWRPYPYAPGRSIAAGKASWLAFVRNASDAELEAAVGAMLADPALNRGAAEALREVLLDQARRGVGGAVQ